MAVFKCLNERVMDQPPFLVAKPQEVLPGREEQHLPRFSEWSEGGVWHGCGCLSAPRLERSRVQFHGAARALLAAIQAATVNAADLPGWNDKVGSIEPGKWADIIAVDGDPLQDVRALENVKFVMKGGQVCKNDYQK